MLTLALPSKGRLMEQVFDWFEGRGVAVRRVGASRAYAAEAPGTDGLDIALLPASEVPGALAQGRAHLGVTGEDLVRESAADLGLVARLGLGRADLVVAVPAFWVDVETMADLDEVAARFRARHGHGLRIATKYPALARAFFHEKGVADYRLIDSQGATEAAPKNLIAEAIVDITSSGATLRDNGLQVLRDGLILESEACLWLSHGADWSRESRRAVLALTDRLGVELPD